MKRVEPIRDIDDIERMKDYVFHKNERDYVLIMFGLYSGMRISDIIPLQVRQVLDSNVEVVERKTGKTKMFAINPALRKALNRYIKANDLKPYDYLFPSRKRVNKDGIRVTHIGRQRAYEIITDAAKHIGLKRIGTHSLRKTFGYHFYKSTHNVALLMEIFNHSSPDITLIYIGYKQDEINQAVTNFTY